MRILLNTISTKKHSGGAYQIAFNFLSKTLEHDEIEWIYVVSADLDETLPEAVKKQKCYYVFPTQPDFNGSYIYVQQKLRKLEHDLKPDIVYSISAPSYFSFKTVEVMRFTNPWVTHPNKFSWATLSWRKRIKMHLYCWCQRYMMKRVNYFITQSETTRQGIIRITGTAPDNVKVVKNVLPSIYLGLESQPFSHEENWINIACVANPVEHKNLRILPFVLKELRNLGIENVRFYVTIPKDCYCWKQITQISNKMRINDRIISYGRLSQIELADLYRHCQLSFLPSLLEVFSASTLEAMFFHLPIVATNFEFNKEVIADACLYYDSSDARSAALQIKKYIDNKHLQEIMKEKMEKRLSLFGDYDNHFNETCNFLKEVVDKHKTRKGKKSFT